MLLSASYLAEQRGLCGCHIALSHAGQCGNVVSESSTVSICLKGCQVAWTEEVRSLLLVQQMYSGCRKL